LRELLRPAPHCPERANTVRIVDNDDHVLVERTVVGAREFHDLIKRRVISTHAEDAV